MFIGKRFVKGLLPVALGTVAAVGYVSADEPTLKIKPVNFQDAGAGANLLEEGELILDQEKQNQLIENFLRARVQEAINEARSIMGENPVGASNLLKQALQSVQSAPELDADVRHELRQQLENGLRHSAEKTEIRNIAVIEENRIAAQRQERERLVRELYVKEEKTVQIMRRFEFLMDEGNYREAEEISRLANTVNPEAPATRLGITHANLVGNWTELIQLREARHRGFAAALASTETSHAPFDDRVPLVYPDPEVWERLTRSREKYSSVDLGSQGEAETAIRQQLLETTNAEFIETPLSDVVEFLKDQHEIPIQLDKTRLDDLGIPTDLPITLQLSGVSLRSALRLMLEPEELAYVIKDEVLLITTKEYADNEFMTTKVYPVADLVVPIESGGGTGLGLTGAMQGGGNSGFGGGQGGGNFAGGGAGGGGFGGGFGGQQGGAMGGGGGGFFNVPAQQRNQGQGPIDKASDDLINLIENVIQPGIWEEQGGTAAIRFHKPTKSLVIRATQSAHEEIGGLREGLRAFSVKDEAAEEKSDEQVKEEVEAVTANKDVSPDVVWDRHFSTHKEPSEAIRKSVRLLIEKKEFKHVIALINAALRHDQAQPWMYEALGLAMRLEGSPKSEIERAVLSALDLKPASPERFVHVANYLVESGSDARALQLYKQVSIMEPNRPEPYMIGLKLAQKLNDFDSLKWAVSGILSQAWPKNKEHISKNAFQVAREMLGQLRAAKRFQEADELEQSLQGALVRDLVVVVSWTGEADVDLAVEEPTGTICDHQNTRTIAGGTLLGDSFTSVGAASTKRTSETYICPVAFDGQYRIRLRRAWGTIPSKNVTVDVYSHHNTDRFQHMRQQVKLGDDDSLVVINLEGGRRKAELADHLVASAVDNQMKVRRQVLMQQIDSLAEGMPVVGELLKSRDRAFANGANPYAPRNSAVGFQPVIIVLSEGATMSAQAVISADRRYIRFTGVPFFSGIGDVTVFNIATGDSSTSSFNGGASGGNFGGGNPGGGGGGGGFGGGGGGF